LAGFDLGDFNRLQTLAELQNVTAYFLMKYKILPSGRALLGLD
jgi:hypothetical protein